MLSSRVWGLEKRVALLTQSRFPFFVAGLAAALAFAPSFPAPDAESQASQRAETDEAQASTFRPHPAHAVFLGFAPNFEARAASSEDMSPLHLARHNRSLEIAPPVAPVASADVAVSAEFVVVSAGPAVEAPAPVPQAIRPLASRLPDPSPLVFERSGAARTIQIASAVVLDAGARPDTGARLPARDTAHAKPSAAPTRKHAARAPVAATALASASRARVTAALQSAGDRAVTQKSGAPLPRSNDLFVTSANEVAATDNRGRGLPNANSDPVARGNASTGTVPIVVASLSETPLSAAFPFVDDRPAPFGDAIPGANNAEHAADHAWPVVAGMPGRSLGPRSLNESAPLTLGPVISDELVFTLAPEPGTAGLLALGLGALALRRRRA